jgi:hypothetical protein
LADLYGRKRVFVLGMAVFVLGLGGVRARPGGAGALGPEW